MKKTLLLCAAMALVASCAFAQGVDLSLVACPGGAGATNNAGAVDCVGGTPITVLLTWVSPGALPDLVGIDGAMDLSVLGDLTTTATFWEFGTGNPNGIASGFARSTGAGCTVYTNTWPSAAGPGSGAGGSMKSPTIEHIAYFAYRGTNLSIASGQKLWGISLLIDPSTSVEAGGGGTGCSSPVGLVVNSLNPRGGSGTDLPEISAQALFGNCIVFNGASTAQCQIVPTKKHTWGQLKSLYR